MEGGPILKDCLKSSISGHKQFLFLYKKLQMMKNDSDSSKMYLNIFSGKTSNFDKKDSSKIFLESGKYPLMYKNGSLGSKFLEQTNEALKTYDAMFAEYDKTKSKSQLKIKIFQIFNEAPPLLVKKSLPLLLNDDKKKRTNLGDEKKSEGETSSMKNRNSPNLNFINEISKSLPPLLHEKEQKNINGVRKLKKKLLLKKNLKKIDRKINFDKKKRNLKKKKLLIKSKQEENENLKTTKKQKSEPELTILDDEIKEIVYIYDSSIEDSDSSDQNEEIEEKSKINEKIDEVSIVEIKSENSISVKSTVETQKKGSLKKKSLFSLEIHKKIQKNKN